MARKKIVTLYAPDLTVDGSPDICIRCGRPATVKPVETLRTHQPSLFTPVFSLTCLMVGQWETAVHSAAHAVHMHSGKSAKVCTPFCHNHDQELWQLRPLPWLAWLLVNLAIGAVVTLALILYDIPTLTIGIVLGGWAALALLWGIALAEPPVPVLEITSERIKLRVHPDYAAAVRQRQLERGERELNPGATAKS
jgi:hypothetical protein